MSQTKTISNGNVANGARSHKQSTSKSPSSTTAANAAAAALTPQAIFYMILLSLQFGMQPSLTRRFTPPTVCRSTVILVQEVTKFCLACFFLIASRNRREATSGWTVSTWISVAFLPAALYSVQNLAALLAYQNLDALTFNVLNQTKTLSAALCCYLVMGRKQSPMQVFALFLLLASALVIEKIVTVDSILDPMRFLGSNDGGDDGEDAGGRGHDARHYTHGVAPVLLASFLSGLAGALTQKKLQSASGTSKGGRDAYLFCMELCVASVIILSASLCFTDDGKRIIENGFFDGWTPQTFLPILTNSLGGIVVGLVTKHAGSVRKGFALIFGIFLSGTAQALTDPTGGGVSKEQVLGGSLAAVSLWMHATNPHVPKKAAAGNGVPTAVGNGRAAPRIKKGTRKSRKED